MKVAFIHRSNTRNVGDLKSCPAQYLNLKGVESVIVDIDEPVPSADWYVVGGGGLLHGRWVDQVADLIGRFGSRTVLWGIGENHHDRKRFSWPLFLRDAQMVGIRDVGNPWERVPCASCLAPEFVNPPSPTEDAVIYSHGDYAMQMPGIPTMNNLGGDEAFPDVIRHLASGHTVITNSYHGAYWSALLGRRTVVVHPFSNRFYGLGYFGLHMVDRIEDWQNKHVQSDPNRAFYHWAVQVSKYFSNRVENLITNSNSLCR